MSALTHLTNTKQKNNSTLPPLSQITPQNVNSIQILKKGKETLIKKIDGHWHITQPISVKANQFRISSLLDLLTTNKYTRYDATNLDLKTFGLDTPSVSVKINEAIYGFGIANPINKKRYVINNKTVYLIDDNFYPLINSQLGTLVDQSLLGDNAVLSSIQTDQFVISKDDKGFWGSSIQASADSVNEIINNWKNARAFGVHDYSPNKNKSSDSINVFLETTPKPMTFIVKSKQPWLVIARPDLNLEYHFDEEMHDRLLLLENPILPEK